MHASRSSASAAARAPGSSFSAGRAGHDGASDAGVGAVVVTTLNSPHLPLVRYAVGDLARRSDVICGCALGTEWSTLHLEGRARDCLATTRGALVTTRAVDDALAALPLWFWRVEQQSASRYALQAVVDDDKGWETLQAAKDALVVVFGADADVTVERVTRFSPERSLKFRQTVSATGSPWSTR